MAESKSDVTKSDVLNVETTVTRVTFFEDRAEVERLAKVAIPAGRSRIHALGLTLLVDDRSLVCKTESAAQIVYSRVRRTSENVAAATAEEVQALEHDVTASQERLKRSDRVLASAKTDGDRALAMMQLWAESVGAVPSHAEKATAELEQAYAAIDEETTRQLDRYGQQRTARNDAQTALSRAEFRLGQGRQIRPRHEAFAEIEVTSDAAAEIAITVVYRTPCALWRPEHLARLTRNDEGTAGEIAITTYAAVWQATGESWKDVPCRFSTARPAQSASAPLLREDVLVTRKKTDMERKQVVVEARDQTIDVAGGGDRGTRDIDEMPGVDDGGEAQWLDARGLATIPSNGQPVRVEIATRKLPCKVERVCFPELGAATHLRANGTLPGPGPLLAGPVTIGREQEIVGKSKTEFVGAGDDLELGFGVDDGLRVRRKVKEKRKTATISGTQTVAREVSLFVSNLSDTGKSLSVTERVPVSEVEDLSIDVERQQGMRFDERDGFATFDVTLAPHATREFVLAYTIEAKSNVVLPPA